MPVELKVPNVGESITEVQIGEWLKGEGQAAEKDENLVEIETEKATMELAAPAAGTVYKVLKRKGDRATVGEVIGYLLEQGETPSEPANVERPKKAKPKDAEAKDAESSDAESSDAPPAVAPVSPAVRRELRKHGLRADEVAATSDSGRLRREDVERHAAALSGPACPGPDPVTPSSRDEPQVSPGPQTDRSALTAQPRSSEVGANQLSLLPAPAVRTEELVPMSMIRRRIGERLVQAQQSAALLTTFNEIDMSAVADLRHEHGQSFQAKHGVKLGFMSFFVKAAVDALKLVPQVNAEVRDGNIVYRNYADICIAVGGGKGLVTPVLRNAERLSFAGIERAISDFAHRAAENRIKPAELSGGTFTISNGGIYGSLLSTPIVNPPQSGILGMHAIQDRPVARDGQVVIRPMMYVALTYDHRVVDGREAVTFLRRIKEAIEEPSRMLLEV
jgi:2-oxoglutarate dehydrogenase E2 component (dihydrolipoamide succinyltransferase)